MVLIDEKLIKDMEKEYKVANYLFAGLSLIYLALSIFLLFSSTYQYIVELVLNILISIIYGWALVYFLTSLRPYLKERYRFAISLGEGVLVKEIVFVSSTELKLHQVDNLYYYQQETEILVDGDRQVRKLLLNTSTSLPLGKLEVRSFNNVVVSYEVLNED